MWNAECANSKLGKWKWRIFEKWEHQCGMAECGRSWRQQEDTKTDEQGSVARHSLRMSDLECMLTECGKNIMNIKSEISENAWASCELSENGLEIFSSIEEIVLEIEENAIDEWLEEYKKSGWKI